MLRHLPNTIPHPNTYFTPGYVRELIEKVGKGHVNQKVIKHIEDVFRDPVYGPLGFHGIVERHPWLVNALTINNHQSMALRMALDSDAVRAHTKFRAENFEHDRFHQDYNTNPQDRPHAPQPPNLTHGPLGHLEATGPASGPSGSGLKHKWIKHVKNYAKIHKITYKQALQEAKRTYK